MIRLRPLLAASLLALATPACAQTTPAATPISALPAASAAAGSDLLTLSQACSSTTTGYCSRKATVAQVGAVIGGGVPGDGTVTAAKLATGAAAGNLGFSLSDTGTIKQDLIAPTVLDCPVANCPTENPTGSDPNHARQRQIRSAHILQGETPIDDPSYPFWESSIGLLNDKGAPNGQEVTQYLGMVQTPGAGSGWTFNTDILRCGTVPTDAQIAAGAYATHGHVGSGVFCNSSQHVNVGSATIGYELDMSNYDVDCPPYTSGVPFCPGIFFNFLTNHTNTAALFLGGGSYGANNVFGFFEGMLLVPGSVKDAAIKDGGNSTYVIDANGAHTTVINTQSDSATQVLTMKAGQRVCFSGTGWCTYYDSTSGRLMFANSANPVMSIDGGGTLRIANTLIQSTTP